MDVSFDRFTLKLDAGELEGLAAILEAVASGAAITPLHKSNARYFHTQIIDAAHEFLENHFSPKLDEPRELDDYLDDFACAEQPEEDFLTAIRCGHIPGGGYVSSEGLHLQPAIPAAADPPDYLGDGPARENTEEIIFDSVRVGKRWSSW